MNPRAFYFGRIEVAPPLVLAPMSGVTHAALRRLIAEMGGCGLFYTEMLSARSIPWENPETSPFLVRHPEEKLLVYQLLVYDPQEVTPAVKRAEHLGAAAIDLNLGCTAPRVVKRGGGLGLLKSPKRLKETAAALRRATALPISAKIRFSGSFDRKWLRDTCRFFEDEGFDMLVVHPRLGKEKLKRPARWELIAEAADAAGGIAVVGNGDVKTAAGAKRMLEATGCRGVMIGRGAAARPWLFRKAAESLGAGFENEVPGPREVYFRFVELLGELIPEERRLGRLKEFTHHFKDNFRFGHRLVSKVQAAKDMEAAVEGASAFFESGAGDELLEEDS